MEPFALPAHLKLITGKFLNPNVTLALTIQSSKLPQENAKKIHPFMYMAAMIDCWQLNRNLLLIITALWPMPSRKIHRSLQHSALILLNMPQLQTALPVILIKDLTSTWRHFHARFVMAYPMQWLIYAPRENIISLILMLLIFCFPQINRSLILLPAMRKPFKKTLSSTVSALRVILSPITIKPLVGSVALQLLSTAYSCLDAHFALLLYFMILDRGNAAPWLILLIMIKMLS